MNRRSLPSGLRPMGNDRLALGEAGGGAAP